MIDLILIAVLAFFTFVGYKRGFIKTILGLLSTFVSLILTTFLSPYIASLIYNISVGEGVNLTTMIFLNVISFLLVVILIKILFTLLVNSLNLVTKLPVIKQANNILGLCTGFLSGLLICYIAVGIAGALSGNGVIAPSLYESITNSLIAGLMYDGNFIAGILCKIIP